MQIYLDGIGLIKDSTVKLDGLTVITGENNSGKSTVGKALYAIIDGMIDIDLKQERDEVAYILNDTYDKLRNAIQALTQPVSIKNTPKFSRIISERTANDSAMEQIFDKELMKRYYRKEALSEFTKNLLNEIQAYTSPSQELLIKKDLNKDIIAEGKKTFDNLKENIMQVCLSALTFLEHGIDKPSFTAKYIQYVLHKEFNNEIQPVKCKDINSKISLQNKQGMLFDCEIIKNYISHDSFKALQHIFSKAFLIDNAFILDEVGVINANSYFYKDIGSSENILTHKEKLIKYLDEPYSPNITFELNDGKKYEKVKQKINAILPGTFSNTPQGLEYIEDNIPLKATNLATGSKMFGIIKMILDKYGLDDSTMLILDEPEAHLHPKWQNAFAEVIVILVKELNVNVLLTSHSPTFVLAIEAFMRKYEIIEKTNFYQTELQEDGFVKYKCVNDDLSVIYEDFATYYGVVKYIREKYYGEFDPDEREDT